MDLQLERKTDRWIGEAVEEIRRQIRDRWDARLLGEASNRLRASSYDPTAVERLMTTVCGASSRAWSDYKREMQRKAAKKVAGFVLAVVLTAAAMTAAVWHAHYMGDVVTGHNPTAAEVRATTMEGR